MNNTATNTVISVKDWLVSLIIALIPVVGIIMLFVWAFGSTTNPNKANLAKAVLLLHLIAIGIFIVLGFLGIGLEYFRR